MLVAATLFAVGCGTGTTDEGTAPDGAVPEDDGADEGTAGPADDVTLTLLTHDSFDVSEDVLASFTDDTGITVQVVPLGDAGTAVNQTILTADSPQGDLLFGVDTTFLSRALDNDIFIPYESPGSSRSRTATSWTRSCARPRSTSGTSASTTTSRSSRSRTSTSPPIWPT